MYDCKKACDGCFCYRAQIKVFIEGLFGFNNDINQFKEHLRDFLVQIKVCCLVSPLSDPLPPTRHAGLPANECSCLCAFCRNRSLLVMTQLIYFWKNVKEQSRKQLIQSGSNRWLCLELSALMMAMLTLKWQAKGPELWSLWLRDA